MAQSIQKTISYDKVIDKAFKTLKDYMDPDPIIDCDTEENIFQFRDKRDIKEQKTTTEKNDLILQKVRSKGENGYILFKEFLSKTQQEELVEFLRCIENGQDTNEIEKRLKEINEKRLNSYPNYCQLRKDLKDDLIQSYRQRHTNIPLSPLFEWKDTPLASFYIRPEINEKKPGNDKIHQNISLTDMFRSGNEVNTELYLTADAGMGKTTFSKYLATLWCQAHCQEEKGKTSFEENDIDCMKKFEFVFLVLLRESYNLCSIDDLILELIVSTLAHSDKFDRGFLQEILNRENCLVILDGLDEWTHPENQGKQCHRSQRSIPHRTYRKTCTVLTTTRPWKLGLLNLSSNEMGKQVALSKLTYDSAVTLIRRTIQILKSPISDDESLEIEVQKIIKEINARRNVNLVFVPLLLMNIICLLVDGVEIAKSNCELYVHTVELFLSKTIEKIKELQLSHNTPSCIQNCFTGHEYCTRFFTPLMSLGKLAYYTLFNEKGEKTLVFDRKVAKTYLKENELNFSLQSGILTESTKFALTKKTSELSFYNKDFQEFFAAVFIDYQNDPQKTVLGKCKNVQSILDVTLIWEFLSKMNTNMMHEILLGFMSVINEDEETTNFRTRKDIEDIGSNPLYNIQKMLLSCSKEMPECENINLCLEDFFIHRDTIHDKDLQRLSKLNKTNMKSLHIDIFPTSSSLHEIIELFSLTELNKLQKLYFDGHKKDADISLLSFPCLQTLCLFSITCTNSEEILRVKLETIQNMQYLNMSELTFSHEIMETFFNFIHGRKSLKELKLEKLVCKEHYSDCQRNFDLSKHSQLKKLELYTLPPLHLNLTAQSLIHVRLDNIILGERSMLLSHVMQNIERLAFRCIEIPPKSIQEFMEVLKDLPQSVTVRMCDITPETEYERVINDVRNSQSFEVSRDSRKFDFKTRKPRKE